MDVVAMVLISYGLGSVLFTSAWLTGVAARRRGLPVLAVVGAAALFPLAWVVWRLNDARPVRVVRRGLVPER